MPVLPCVIPKAWSEFVCRTQFSSAVCERRDLSQPQQIVIGSYQRQVQYLSGSGKEAISRILVWQVQLSRDQSDLVSQRRFSQGCRSVGYPFSQIGMQQDSSFCMQRQRLPCADRGQPQFVVRVQQFVLHPAS